MSVVNVGAAFLWGWRDGTTSTSLNQCGVYSISVVSLSDTTSYGVPPYYMVAWKPDGVPTVSALGSDRTNLSWQVNHAAGSSLVLAVADSRGMTGGVDPYIYNVVDNSSTSNCLPSSPSANLALSANISTSESLNTCETMRLQVSGGQKPYTITVAVLNSTMIANVTLGENDDVLNWPNRANPSSQLIAAVSDANGIWGTSTGIYNTAGDSNTNCAMSATSANSADGNEQSPLPSASSDENQKSSSSGSSTTLIVAIVVSVVVVGLLVGLVFILLRRCRRRQPGPQPAIVPDAWLGPSSFTNRDSNASGKVYQRVPNDMSEEAVLGPKIVIQHEDAADVQELPPPYLVRNA